MAQKILIADAGLGGLTAAGLLLQAGHDVEVYEQARALGEVGAGIQVSANASRVLRHPGVLDEVADAAMRPERTEFRLHDTGEIVRHIPLGDAHEAAFGAPYYHVYRPGLHRILAARVHALKPGAIHLNAGVAGYEETAGGVALTPSDGRRVEGMC